MRLVIALFLLAVLTAAATTVGFAVWDGRILHRDSLRTIHYDTKYDMSSQRRRPSAQP
jgi:hypothetical protein